MARLVEVEQPQDLEPGQVGQRAEDRQRDRLDQHVHAVELLEPVGGQHALEEQVLPRALPRHRHAERRHQLAHHDEVLGLLEDLHRHRGLGAARAHVAQVRRRHQPRVGLAVADRGQHVDDRLLLARRVVAVELGLELGRGHPRPHLLLGRRHRQLGHLAQRLLGGAQIVERRPRRRGLGFPQEAQALVVVLAAHLVVGAADELVVLVVVVGDATAEPEPAQHAVLAPDDAVDRGLDPTVPGSGARIDR